KPAVGIEPSQLAPNLWAINVTPAAALAEYGLMILKLKSIYEMVFENRVTKAFVRAIPGIDDFAVLGKAWFHTTEEKRGKPLWDTVVFDLPASGHSISMLKVPSVIVETIPEGPVTKDALAAKQLLADPVRTALVIVTLAEEMPVNEAIELGGKLTSIGIAPQLTIANQVFPEHFPAGSPVARILDTLAASPGSLATPLRELTAHAVLSSDRRGLNQRYLAELVSRSITPVVELPMLFAKTLGVAEVNALSRQLVASAG
ncbi:MAG: ArsA family ATPase, partial [Kofleriaceae bacterium]